MSDRLRTALVACAVLGSAVALQFLPTGSTQAAYFDSVTIGGNIVGASDSFGPPKNLIVRCGERSEYSAGYVDVPLPLQSPFRMTVPPRTIGYVDHHGGTVQASAGTCLVVTGTGINIVGIDPSVKVVFAPGLAAANMCSVGARSADATLSALFTRFPCDQLPQRQAGFSATIDATKSKVRPAAAEPTDHDPAAGGLPAAPATRSGEPAGLADVKPDPPVAPSPSSHGSPTVESPPPQTSGTLEPALAPSNPTTAAAHTETRTIATDPVATTKPAEPLDVATTAAPFTSVAGSGRP